MLAALVEAVLQPVHVDRVSGRKDRCRDRSDVAEAGLAEPVCGNGDDVIAKCFANGPGQRVAWSDLHEGANAVCIGLAKGFGEIHFTDGLAGEHVGNSLGIRYIGFAGGIRIEANLLRRLRLAMVQGPPGFGVWFHHWCVHDKVMRDTDG